MFKATQDIGQYKKGDVVPDDKAKIWLGMYVVPCVEEIDDLKVSGMNAVEEEPIKPKIISGFKKKFK